jgi:hypothetical protein
MTDPKTMYEITDEERNRLAVLAIEAKEKAYCKY